MTDGGTFQGDWRQKPVKNKVWLNCRSFQLNVSPTSGEVKVILEQRDRSLYLKKVNTDVGVGNWGPWNLSPKGDKADFRLTLQTMKKNTVFSYTYEAPTA